MDITITITIPGGTVRSLESVASAIPAQATQDGTISPQDLVNFSKLLNALRQATVDEGAQILAQILEASQSK